MRVLFFEKTHLRNESTSPQMWNRRLQNTFLIKDLYPEYVNI